MIAYCPACDIISEAGEALSCHCGEYLDFNGHITSKKLRGFEADFIERLVALEKRVNQLEGKQNVRRKKV